MRTLDKIKLWLKVNLYNPYKPHIVYSDKFGGYAIRRYNWVIGWEYLDNKDEKFFWWSDEGHVSKWCRLITLPLAKERLLKYNEKIAPDKFVRVIE